ncbi:DUF1343 domain-containing protein [Cytophagaceae bacterium AH-315-L13]|nr:DUF1343 domain-containing protein [Cytophagaceae bacterium AH-315-L13]
MKNYILIILFLFLVNAAKSQDVLGTKFPTRSKKIVVGAERVTEYLPIIKDKTIAIVANQTSLIGNTHLVDSLLKLKQNIKLVFAPEHGFRGTADAGEHLSNNTDKTTGLPIISLYGDKNKPSNEDLNDIDIVIFDIQDVGVRYYTYVTTMHYVMEACAENDIEFLVLDRPNPNGFYIDGPVLKPKFASFVGRHPIPLVHGLTIAEYARMVNEEGWLKDGVKCKLQYIVCENYTHESIYKLPVKPSPNLRNMRSIYLYPSLGLFEGTNISVGRGTDAPFQVLGHPKYKKFEFSFTPESKPGAKYPPHKGKLCYGFDLTKIKEQDLASEKQITLNWVMVFYQNSKNKRKFFNSFFTNLAGTDKLQKQIEDRMLEKDIRATWQGDIKKYKQIRKKYLLYKDFE